MKDLRRDNPVQRNLRQSHFFHLLPALARVMLITLSFMVIFVIVRHWIYPDIMSWRGQMVTIGFSAFGATIGAYIAFRTYFDVSEYRQRTLEALRESEDRYRGLFDRVPVGLYRTTPDGQILDANPALVEMLGYPDLETLLAVNARDVFINPEDRQREMALLDQAGVVINIEIQLRRYDGATIWVEDTVRSILGTEGRVLYYDGSLEDITERKGADEVRAWMASIVESSDDAIIGMTLDGTIITWNSAAERIYGYTMNEIKGHSVFILTPSGYNDELPQILDRIKNGGRVEHYETVRKRKSGEQIHVSLTISPILNVAGDIIGISKIARDITERKRMEQYVLRTERLAAMGNITAALAHEVKNPLQSILNNLELALNFSLESDETEECLQVCLREVERLIEITQRMLGFVRPEREAYHPISIPVVWQRTYALLNKTLQLAAIQVTTDIPENLPRVMGIPDQISQVFLNLVLNVRQALPSGGNLHIEARVEREMLVLTLTNNGPPIPDEHIEHIFDPFFTTKPDSTGLGLYISHTIIQQHGGTLSVQNLEGGKGVSFTITLPIADRAVVTTTDWQEVTSV